MKKKVLFVIHQLNIGGVQKSFITALDSIDYDKFEVTVYIRSNKLDLIKEINSNVSEIIINNDNRRYYRHFISIILSFFALFSNKAKLRLNEYIAVSKIRNEARQFRDRKFDIAISYIQGYSSLLVSDFISAEKKIVFFHGSVDENHELHKSVFNSFDLIVGVNKEVALMLKNNYSSFSSKISFLNNYVDYNRILKQSSEFTIPKSKYTICTCGRISVVKGFDIAVNAAKELKDKGCDFLWYFVGDGPESDNIKSLIEDYALGEFIILTGMQHNPYPYMNCADIIVSPSREEAMPLCLLEAQILCKPVVTTKTVGGMNIVKNGITGIHTEINGEALAEGIIKAMDKDLLASMTKELSSIDYNTEKERYKFQWAEILE